MRRGGPLERRTALRARPPVRLPVEADAPAPLDPAVAARAKAREDAAAAVRATRTVPAAFGGPATPVAVPVGPASRAARLRRQVVLLHAAQEIVRARAAGRCECCSAPLTAVEHHHRQPRGMGGTGEAAVHSPANLLALLPACHVRWEARRAEAVERGLLVPRGQDPAATPVLRHGVGFVLLAVDGSYAEVARGRDRSEVGE